MLKGSGRENGGISVAKTIMIQGTMSNAGKSLLAAGLCRIFAQAGYRVAPFKSQNMALNSYITREGLEMGRAQVVQAQAAGIEPSADMNPILLKPSSDVGSQVIVHGIPVGTMPAREYFAYKKSLIPAIMESFYRLEKQYDIVVIEGAGSPAEINLKQDDIVNMGMAELAKAPVLLAGDIDRGGVFAQLYGTIMLLTPRERSMVKGLIINKFRGDKTILDPGVEMIEKLCGIPVAGVVPYMKVDIEDEDSLSSRLTAKKGEEDNSGKSLLNLTVIRFPRLSNFTDFQVFEGRKGVSLRYVDRLSDFGRPDMIFLPGTKNTMEDLLWFRQSGLEAAVLKAASSGIPVWGICGGYQMMGNLLVDSEGWENGIKGVQLPGMGLLPAVTSFTEEKTRTRVTGQFGSLEGFYSCFSGFPVEGYEIHMGKTEVDDGSRLLTLKEYQKTAAGDAAGKSGVKADGICRGILGGTYVHGIFDAPGIAEALLQALLEKKGLSAVQRETGSFDYAAYREQQYDILAEQLRANLDMKTIYRILEQGLT